MGNTERDKINAIAKAHESQTRKFLEKVFSMYPGIELWGIKDIRGNNSKAFRVGTAKSVKEAMHMLKEENAWWKNTKYVYDFYYKPSKTQEFNYLFFDFDTPIKRELLENAYMVVSTSPGKFHVYIKLEKPIQTAEYKGIVKEAIHHIDVVGTADPACVDPYHLRRLGGMYNNKHEKVYEISFVMGKNEVVPTQTIEKLKAYAVVNGEVEKSVNTTQKKAVISDINGEAAVWLQEHANDRFNVFYAPVVKTRKEFAKQTSITDQSVIDFAYACYLFAKGRSVKEVFNTLRDQREDLIQKHPLWLDYLKRTIMKAYESVGKKFEEIYQEVRT